MVAEPRLFRNLCSILVESIFWDARTDQLVWVDITAGELHRARLDGAADGGDDRVDRLPPPVSAVQPAHGDGFVAALEDRVVLLDGDARIVREVAPTPHRHPGIRTNEGKVDPFGRFVVGAMDVTTSQPDAAVRAVDLSGAIEDLRDGFGVANGFEWSDDGSIMYLTDTSVRTVCRALYRREAPSMGDLQPFLTGFSSDGLARARDGSLWNGVYGDGTVIRWDAEGTATGRVEIPAPDVTSVAFGGPGLSTLYVGTARENLTQVQLDDAPLSGSIFAVDVGASGRPPHMFGITSTT